MRAEWVDSTAGLGPGPKGRAEGPVDGSGRRAARRAARPPSVTACDAAGGTRDAPDATYAPAGARDPILRSCSVRPTPGIRPPLPPEVSPVSQLVPILLPIHILTAIVAFGPGFVFPLIARMAAQEPQHGLFALRLTDLIERRVVIPAALTMPISGGLLAWSEGIDPTRTGWLLTRSSSTWWPYPSRSSSRCGRSSE